MNTVKIYGKEYNLEDAQAGLENWQRWDEGLQNGKVRPSKLVGTGYKNNRIQAERYVAGKMAMYHTLIDILKEG